MKKRAESRKHEGEGKTIVPWPGWPDGGGWRPPEQRRPAPAQACSNSPRCVIGTAVSRGAQLHVASFCSQSPLPP
jgi:hypothetical protein